jgi:hypothetical protein
MEFLFVTENETFNILITIVLFATSFVVRFVCFFYLFLFSSSVVNTNISFLSLLNCSFPVL